VPSRKRRSVCTSGAVIGAVDGGGDEAISFNYFDTKFPYVRSIPVFSADCEPVKTFRYDVYVHFNISVNHAIVRQA
jgi:hypothetical protein